MVRIAVRLVGRLRLFEREVSPLLPYLDVKYLQSMIYVVLVCAKYSFQILYG